MRRALPVALAAAVVAGAGAAPAQATLVYVKNFGSTKLQPSVWVAADDGSGGKRLLTAAYPRISPDGATVVVATTPKNQYRQTLKAIPAVGGTAKTLLNITPNPNEVHFSPDSTRILAISGPELGPYTLNVIDVATAKRTALAKGFFYGASWSPDGTQVVYARSSKDDYGPKSDLYTVAPTGGTPKRLTTDGQNLYPVWGPAFIAFTHAKPRKNDAPQFNIWRIDPAGTNRRAITKDKAPTLLSGLTPTAFSFDGTRLLSQFGGQDTSYAVAVDPATGKEKVLGPKNEAGHLATDISRDGSTVLVATGGFDPGSRHDVGTVPFTGGRTTVLVRNASQPDWNR